MARHRYLDEIRQLDPVADHQRIVHLLVCYEFPFDITRALEIALFRTFCVPRTSDVLDRTGEFRQRAQKRYDDTDLIVSELMEQGYDSARGLRALRRMNQLHGRFAIGNTDFLYVLSTFIYEPIRWNQRWGWRPMTDTERLALFHFWRQVGHRMGIRAIPEDYAEFERFNVEHERTQFATSDSVRRTGAAVRKMFLSWFPAPLRPLVRPFIHAALDGRARQAFGFPDPPPGCRWLLDAAMGMRAAGLRHLPDPRRPRLRTQMWHPTYPRGYEIETLGPT